MSSGDALADFISGFCYSAQMMFGEIPARVALVALISEFLYPLVPRESESRRAGRAPPPPFR